MKNTPPFKAGDLAGIPDPSAQDQELAALRSENIDLYRLYEDAQARINALTVTAEIARLEFEQVFNAVADATLIISTDRKILRTNRAFLSMIGCKSPSEVIGRSCFDLLQSSWCRSPQCPIARVGKRRQRMEQDVRRIGPEGVEAPYLLTVMPLYGLSDEMIGIVLQWKDISERKRYERALEKANARLKAQATVDGLTGIANRRTFDERLDFEWRRLRRERQPLSLIMADIDFFKRYNDRYGHLLGDECLKTVADRFQAELKRPADLAARYGGEEFAAILPNTPLDKARHVAECIRSAVEDLKLPHADSSASPWVTLSVGVATTIPLPDADGDQRWLIDAADAQLYASKNAGRNQVSAASGRVESQPR
jgi:two-component system cell cycle response regulator